MRSSCSLPSRKAKDALRSDRPAAVLRRGRRRLDHRRRGAERAGAGRRLDPHPRHGGGAGRAAADPLAPGRHAHRGRPHPAASTRGPCSAQSARLREDLSAFAGGMSGEVRLLANTNALTEFLPEALSAFLADHPQVSVDLEERLSDEIVGLVAEGVGRRRHRRRHGRCGGAGHLSVPLRPLRGGDRGGPPLARPAASSFAQVLDYDFVGLDRASLAAAVPGRQGGARGPAAAPARAAAQLRRGLPAGGMRRGRRRRAGQTTAARAAKTMALASSTSPTTGRCAN